MIVLGSPVGTFYEIIQTIVDSITGNSGKVHLPHTLLSLFPTMYHYFCFTLMPEKKMAQQLRILVAFAEDQSSIPSTNLAAHNHV